MDDLPPIPTPLPQRWREFRIQILPLIVFLLAVVTIVYLWRNYVHVSEIVGEVEIVKSDVITTTEGSLEELLVDRFDTVVKGQPIGRIVTINSALIEASLQAIAADQKIMQARMDLDRFRNQDSVLRMRLDLITEQVALELAQIRLKQAQSELQRYERLFADKLITEGMSLSQGAGMEPSRFNFGLDVARRDRDLLQSEVTTRTRTVAQLDQEIQRLAASPMTRTEAVDPIIEAAIRAQQDELRLLNEPIVLKAPMDGVVTNVFKHAGEKVARGDVIASIASLKSQRVIGYVRQPINRVPTTNDSVIISTRAQRRQQGVGTILKVGSHLEPINPLLLSADGASLELGLPFFVSVPDELRVLPGEYVDMSIRYAKP